jgi:hypothetical protein
MSGNGASLDEMRLAIRDDVQLGAFAAALRATLVAPPDPDRAAELAPRLAGAARASLATEPHVGRPSAGQRRRSRLGLIARAGVAVALMLALSAGMAVAGVKLPDAVDATFEAAGIELPNQGGEGSGGGAESGKSDEPDGAREPGEAGAGDVGGPADPGARGRENAREHGGKAHGPGGAKPESPGGGNAHGQTQGGKGVGKDGTPPGQANPNAGGRGTGKAVGRTDATPPGQAGKPANPGKSNGAGAGASATQGSSKGGKEK